MKCKWLHVASGANGFYAWRRYMFTKQHHRQCNNSVVGKNIERVTDIRNKTIQRTLHFNKQLSDFKWRSIRSAFGVLIMNNDMCNSLRVCQYKYPQYSINAYVICVQHFSSTRRLFHFFYCFAELPLFSSFNFCVPSAANKISMYLHWNKKKTRYRRAWSVGILKPPFFRTKSSMFWANGDQRTIFEWICKKVLISRWPILGNDSFK